MQVQRVQNNSPQFNGTLRFYNFRKKKWSYRHTTPKEDKMLYDLFEKFCPKNLTKVPNCGSDKFVGEMEYDKVLEFIDNLPKFKGFDRPIINVSNKINANITEYNVPHIDRPFDIPSSMHGYEIDLHKTFKMRHWFDKLELAKKNLWQW